MKKNELKALVKEIEILKASPEVKRLAKLERKLKKENADPKNAIKNSIGVNEGGFTRFNHKPDNLIVTFRDTKEIIGSINWEGQRWDWGMTFRTPSPEIQKVVKINPIF
jgi:hypothetical protein